MKLIKKKLLLLPLDPISVKTWEKSERYPEKEYAASVGIHTYQEEPLLTITYYTKSKEVYARLFLSKSSYITFMTKDQKWKTSILENTPKGMYGYGKNLADDWRIWLSGKSKKTIRKWCESKYSNSLSDISWEQRKINAKASDERLARKMQEVDKIKISEIEPKQPKNLEEWAKRKGLGKQKYIFFSGKLKKSQSGAWLRDGVCSACGQKVEIEKHIEHNDLLKCPNCKKQVIAKKKSLVKVPITDFKKVLVFTKIQKSVLAISYELIHSTSSNAEESISIMPMNAYYFGKNKEVYRFAKWERYGIFGKYIYLDEWQYKRGIYDFGWDYVYPMGKALKGTVLENSMLVDYIKCRENLRKKSEFHNLISPIMKYCEQYLKYPCLENLQREGYYSFVTAKLANRREDSKAVNWKEASPRKVLGLNKQEAKRAKEEQWSIRTLECYRFLKSEKMELTTSNLKIYQTYKNMDIEELELQQLNFGRFSKYIEKQSKADEDYETAVIHYKDYIIAGKQLNYDFTDDAVLYPRNLEQAHTRAIAAREYLIDKELQSNFQKTYKTLSPLKWEQGKYIIQPAKNQEELITEGKELSHCVGGYGKEHCNVKPIFFIREKEDPNVPFYTLQLDITKKEVIQNRGHYNRPTTDAIDKFVEQWLAQVVEPYNFKTRKFKHKKVSAA